MFGGLVAGLEPHKSHRYTTQGANTERIDDRSIARSELAPNVVASPWWVALIALVVLGAAAVILRLAFPADAASRLEPLRQAILDTGPPTEQRLADLADFDARFAAHRGVTALHIVPGGLFLLLLPLQLSRAVRSRWVKVHRWNGRVLIVAGIVTTITALYFGITVPFGGVAELVVVVPVAIWFLVSLARGFLAIRRHDAVAHRRWMLRAISAPLGVTVIRIIGTIADLSLTPAGASARTAFVTALWIGWALTFAVAEWWIRRTAMTRQELSFRMK